MVRRGFNMKQIHLHKLAGVLGFIEKLLAGEILYAFRNQFCSWSAQFSA